MPSPTEPDAVGRHQVILGCTPKRLLARNNGAVQRLGHWFKAMMAALYREERAFVRRVLRRHGCPAADLDDVVQEVFLNAVHGAPRFANRAHPRTWLYAICVRTLRRFKRKSWTTPESPLTRDQSLEVGECTASSEDELLLLEKNYILNFAFRKLPAQDRDVLALIYGAELSLGDNTAGAGVELFGEREWARRASAGAGGGFADGRGRL